MVHFLTNFTSEEAEHPKIWLSFGGNMPKAQVKQRPTTPPPHYLCKRAVKYQHSLNDWKFIILSVKKCKKTENIRLEN